MRRYTSFFIFTVIFLTASRVNFSQSQLEVFGFVQTQVKYQKGTYERSANVLGTTVVLPGEKNDLINGSIQQLNLFFRKELSDNITGWVNFEVLNNYSSDNKWGGMNLEEAWVSYQYSDAFSAKGGLLVPRFNHMNEIKNRMPLIPYITRPLIFEPTLKNTINASIYLPQRAFLQFTGTIPTEQVLFDYAVFVGNNTDTLYKNSDPSKIAEVGSDINTKKMVGGRLGAKYSNFYVGVSTTFDVANYQKSLNEDVKRNRIGFDFGGSMYNFFVEGEYIKVALDAKNTTADLNKSFYYATLGYNITEQWYMYGSLSKLKDAENPAFKNDGLTGNIFGAGFKPIPSLVLKAEFSSYSANSTFDTPILVSGVGPVVSPVTVDVDFKAFQLAASFLF